MIESRRRSSGGSSANRWLIVAGAGLVILAFVARMLLDIGQTKVSDLRGILRPDTANATSSAIPVPADTIATPPAAEPVTTNTPAPPTIDTSVKTASPPPPATTPAVAAPQATAKQADTPPADQSSTGPKGAFSRG